ncbi:MAG: GNAT family N-acetyltransferase [Methanomassiliicoccales archaeon]
MRITIEEISSASKWAELEDEWHELLSSSDENDLFLTFDWLYSWWATYGEGRKMRLIIARENDAIVGVAPIMISSIGKLLKLRIAEFIGTGPSDHLGIILKEGRRDVAQAIWMHLNDLDDWDIMDLRDMRSDLSTACSLTQTSLEAEREENVDPYIPLRGDFERYMRSLSKSYKHNIERSWRRLNEEHMVRVEAIKSPERMKEAFDILLALNSLRWQGRGKSTLESPPMREFLKNALRRLAPKNNVVFHVLYAEEVAISITLGFHYGGRYLYYLSGFNPEYHNFGPGRCLLAKIIQDSYEQGLKEVDLLRGNEDYKFRFNPEQRKLLRFRTKKKGVRAGLSELVGI